MVGRNLKLTWDDEKQVLTLYKQPRFIVMTSTAQVNARLRRANKRFYNVAVVETDGECPAMISKRARHVVRIVKHYGACAHYPGKGNQSPYYVAMEEAYALVDQLNRDYAAAQRKQEDEECGS